MPEPGATKAVHHYHETDKANSCAACCGGCNCKGRSAHLDATHNGLDQPAHPCAGMSCAGHLYVALQLVLAASRNAAHQSSPAPSPADHATNTHIVSCTAATSWTCAQHRLLLHLGLLLQITRMLHTEMLAEPRAA
jgi:hypothetical protein